MLSVVSVDQAEALCASLAGTVPREETLPLSALSGRVLSRAVRPAGDVPLFSRSAMDGYAVIAADTFGAGESAPAELTVIGQIAMGEETALSLAPGEAARIPTGGMLPKNADAAVPVEYTEEDGFSSVLVYRGVSPLENVVRRGDDLRGGDVLFAPGVRLDPAKIASLAAAGIERCAVYARPRVGILSTGNEVDPVGAPDRPGRVRDVNSHLLYAVCLAFGCEPRLYGIVPDELGALKAALSRAAAENDLILLSGGSSAGERDLTAAAISALGELLAHGVAMKPGKPTVIGRVGPAPVFGLPGHPAACYFVAETLVRRCIETLSGALLPAYKARATLTDNISSNHGRTEFVCVRLSGGKATPVYGKSGVVSQLSRADGYLRVERDREGVSAGAEVEITLFERPI